MVYYRDVRQSSDQPIRTGSLSTLSVNRFVGLAILMVVAGLVILGYFGSRP